MEGAEWVELAQDIVAADLLKQYQKKFQGGTLAVTWNYLRESMSTYMSQPNPVTSRWEDEDHLRDSTFQLDAFRYRTSRLLHSAAMRLQKHTKTLGSKDRDGSLSVLSTPSGMPGTLGKGRSTMFESDSEMKAR
ncbi:hypothetical protein POM88_025866 [Heracleum sosnowskyi]|uniref:Uncharacterized protein n=1 Tax=Heracleum sosnowskyi TaxID=360622 RepID=A0AAD8I6Z2_9APIA|nr:hypothetical protein POM88_025866 [Heracleum sosnowskyi]